MNQFIDPDRGTLELVQRIATGRSYDVLRVRDVSRGRDLVARAPRYLDGTEDDREAWVDAAARELEATAGAPAHLPGDAELWMLDGSEPVVCYPFIDGIRLDAWMAEHAPNGLDTATLLAFARDVAEALSELHSRGLVHRCLTPDHVLITPERRAVLVGLGNASRRSEPACSAKPTTDDAYSAPEILSELSGRFNTPRSDVFAFGMLMSFMATGQRPTGDGAAPLTRTAYERLVAGSTGVALLVARCIQPLQKNRIGLDKLREHMSETTLPSESTVGFGSLALLTPWGAGGGIGLPVGHLSPGPLVDRPAASPQKAKLTAPNASSSVREIGAATDVVPANTPAAVRSDSGRVEPAVEATGWSPLGVIAGGIVLAIALVLTLQRLFG